MSIEIVVNYNPDTGELFINGQLKGVYHEKVAATEVSDAFLSAVRRSEINKIFANACK